MNAHALRWVHQSAAAALARAEWADDWDRLNRSRGNLPFLDAQVVALALKHFGQGDEVLSVARDAAGQVRAMVVLSRVGKSRWSSFQPSQLPLGAWVADPALGVSQLSRSLVRRAPGPLCLALSLTQIDPRLAPREPDSSGAQALDYIATGWIEVAGDFDSYWAARGKNLRQNLRKQRNKLAAEGVQTQMRVLRERGEMRALLERYGALESTGWKGQQGTAIHPDNAQGRFYLELFEAAAERSEALVFEYRFDDRTVAMNLCLLRAGELIVLKTAYDESIRTLSPAFLLREEELQQFFAPGSPIRRIEYYGKLMDWHTKLTDNQRTLYHHTRYRWSWLKRLVEARRQRQAEAQAPQEDSTALASTQEPDSRINSRSAT